MHHISSLVQPCTLCRWDEVSASDRGIDFLTHSAARSWLLGFKSSPASMSDLREALQRLRTESSLLRYGDDQVIDELAWLIVTTRVVVLPRQQDLPDQGIDLQRSVGSSSPPPAAAGRTRSAASAPPPPESTTLPGNTDVAAMAATLVAAAAGGVPLCEICEKLKNERQQPADAAV